MTLGLPCFVAVQLRVKLQLRGRTSTPHALESIATTNAQPAARIIVPPHASIAAPRSHA
jgi:hypothetical protein